MANKLETFKAMFLILGFIAIGFGMGCYWTNARFKSICPPPWWKVTTVRFELEFLLNQVFQLICLSRKSLKGAHLHHPNSRPASRPL